MTGLDDAVNRWHMPGWGRFTSADPYKASAVPDEPGGWNRFAYVGGDLINYTDPGGLIRLNCNDLVDGLVQIGCESGGIESPTEGNHRGPNDVECKLVSTTSCGYKSHTGDGDRMWRRSLMKYFAAALVGFSLLFQSRFASAQIKASKVFLLEDAANSQWCSYTTESTWKAKVQEGGAMTIGTLAYSNDHLSQINLTTTDESGDWTVHDHYFFDDHGQLVKLSRLLNVLPGDRSVSQAFSINNGKVTKTATSETQLSTGKPVTAPTADWLPDVSIETATKMFPFSALLGLPGLRTSPKSCVKVPVAQ